MNPERFLVAALAGLALLAPATAAADLSSLPDLSAANPNRTALAIAVNGSRTYVATERATMFATRTFGTAVVSPVSGALRAVPDDAGLGVIDDAVADPAGGWYVAGESGVRHLRADGTVDPLFSVAVGGFIRSIALSPDGATLWLAGNLSTVDGALRRAVAAVATSDGALRAFNASEAAEGWEVAQEGGVLYFAGRSSTGAALLALDAGTGAVLARGPAGTAGALVAAPGTVYVSLINADRPGAEVTAYATPGLQERWTRADRDPDSLVLSPDGGTLYMSAPLGALRTDTGALLDWAPRGFTGDPGELALSRDGSVAYVTNAFKPGWPSQGAVALSTTDAAVLAWLPNVAGDLYTVAVAAGGGSVLLGASSAGSVRAERAALLDETGQPVPWSDGAFADGSVATAAAIDAAGAVYTAREGGDDGSVSATTPDGTLRWRVPLTGTANAVALSSDQHTLYVGGAFSAPRSGLAAIDTATGAVLPWAPVVTGGPVATLATHGDAVYAGGRFDAPRKDLAAFDGRTGALLGFDARVNAEEGRIADLELSPDGSRLYLVGSYQGIAGRATTGAVALRTTDATVAWSTSYGGAQIAASPDGRTVVLGGGFEDPITHEYRWLLALDGTTGAKLGWDAGPGFQGDDGAAISEIVFDPDGHTLHAGGDSSYRTARGFISGYCVRFGGDRDAATPLNHAAPRVVGSATANAFVACDPGAWSGDPAAYAFGWRVGGVAVPGADTRSLLLTAADAGLPVQCEVAAGGPAAGSAPVTIVAGPAGSTPAPRRVGQPAPTPAPGPVPIAPIRPKVRGK
ncbi:PQQ-like beta-propeller repeat protein [Solirubrobacter ginsenosidimutans]|uniref:PQQ-like beta-propeller repeat protein n=1 Tax=Solirubrobacter ginsenosidimutans TaxID=490573 RepID=A0A9X3MUK3_9ACTN|nr:hypothetical protein [Solirubrobacter ginsenosidimutans]MDA0162979.1 PQQ-like beta-propeller repeat protein [Solirubrobacter ginsenosidimutans]